MDGTRHQAPGRARELDQFFTRPEVAAALLARLHRHLGDEARGALWIEPSAGAGAFLDGMPEGAVGLDISPVRADVAQADFLSWTPTARAAGPVVVAGNPPFGRGCKTAVRFFNHAAGFADWIAFVVPRTFQKASLRRRLHRSFHLVAEHVLDPWSFVFEGRPYDVPTVFQVWRRGDAERVERSGATRHADFDFVAAHEAEFAFQRVGVAAGRVSVAGLSKSRQSHYFIRPAPGRDVFPVLAAIDWTPVKGLTAGNPSIGKAELVAAYEAASARAALAA